MTNSLCGHGGIFSLLSLVVAVSVPAAAETKRYVPKPEDLKYTFATVEPVMVLKPGDWLETWTQSAFGEFAQNPETTSPRDFRPNPNTGPFYIEGAEPGDTLVVKLIKVEPTSDFAYGLAPQGFGALTQTRYTPMLDEPIRDRIWTYRIDKQAETVEFSALDADFKVNLPLRPFLGCLGVAPAADETYSTITPGFFGGNMDTPEVRAGTTVYLPVNVSGALLYLGDGHAAQGEGEIAGTAAEVEMNVVLSVDVIKGRTITTPRLEDDTPTTPSWSRSKKSISHNGLTETCKQHTSPQVRSGLKSIRKAQSLTYPSDLRTSKSSCFRRNFSSRYMRVASNQA